ncbi:MAG: helix-turn-helix transcriptional regulator [Roseburia sp.]|nr:helix-turn-helix transcriptional regulator [Roseburia sp.]
MHPYLAASRLFFLSSTTKSGKPTSPSKFFDNLLSANFWNTMKSKKISQYQLLKMGIDNKTLDGLKHNKNITVLTLEKLCTIIGCTPNDIIEFK